MARHGSCSISDIFLNNWITFLWIPSPPQAHSICREIEVCPFQQHSSMDKQFWFDHAGNDWHYEFGERRIHSVRKSRNQVLFNSFRRFVVNVWVEKQFTRFSMKPTVLPIIVILFLVAKGNTQPLADPNPNQNQIVNECSKESSLVYEEKGDFNFHSSDVTTVEFKC